MICAKNTKLHVKVTYGTLTVAFFPDIGENGILMSQLHQHYGRQQSTQYTLNKHWLIILHKQ